MPDLIGHHVQKHSEIARDTIIFLGIARSFRIKVNELSPNKSSTDKARETGICFTDTCGIFCHKKGTGPSKNE